MEKIHFFNPGETHIESYYPHEVTDNDFCYDPADSKFAFYAFKNVSGSPIKSDYEFIGTNHSDDTVCVFDHFSDDSVYTYSNVRGWVKWVVVGAILLLVTVVSFFLPKKKGKDKGWGFGLVFFIIAGGLAFYIDAGGDFGRSKRLKSSSYNYNYDYDCNIGAGSSRQDPAGHNTVGFDANKRVDGAENTSDGYIPSGQITLYRRSNGDASVFDLYINSTNRYVKVGKNAFKKIKNGEVKVNGVTYCTKP